MFDFDRKLLLAGLFLAGILGGSSLVYGVKTPELNLLGDTAYVEGPATSLVTCVRT